MKKIILLCFGIMYLCIHTFAQISDRITFDPSSLKFTTENSFNKVSFENCSFTKESGSPCLPYLTVNYLIPFNQKVSSIVISDSTSIALTGRYNIYPSQPERPINEPPTEFVNPNPAIYNNNTKFPSTLIEIIGQYYDKGYHIITLNIYPVSYRPLSKALRLITSVSFTLNYEFEPDVPVKPVIQSEFMNDLVKRQTVSTVKNGTEINTMYEETTRSIESSDQQGNFFKSFTPESGFGVITPQYIIITNNTDVDGKPIPTYNGKNMTQTFQQLAEWKTKKGVPTHVITIDYIKSVSKGCDLEEKIHNYLADIYKQYGTIYILFGGDNNIIPARMLINQDKLLYISDLYYTAIESSWNTNCNDTFGDYNDIIDKTSEFYFGRALVENTQKANIFVDKVIKYETLNQCPNINYVNNYLFMAGYITYIFDDDKKIFKPNGTSIANIKEITNFSKSITGVHKWHLYDEYTLYEGDQELTLSNVLYNLNKGQGFGKFHLIYHLDHSSYSNMGTSSQVKNQSLHRDDMDNLLNTNFWQILYSNGCEPGDFSRDCIIKHYLNNPNGGGVAAIASSDISYSDEMEYFFNIINMLGKTTGNSEHFYNIGVLHDKSINP